MRSRSPEDPGIKQVDDIAAEDPIAVEEPATETAPDSEPKDRFEEINNDTLDAMATDMLTTMAAEDAAAETKEKPAAKKSGAATPKGPEPEKEEEPAEKKSERILEIDDTMDDEKVRGFYEARIADADSEIRVRDLMLSGQRDLRTELLTKRVEQSKAKDTAGKKETQTLMDKVDSKIKELEAEKAGLYDTKSKATNEYAQFREQARLDEENKPETRTKTKEKKVERKARVAKKTPVEDPVSEEDEEEDPAEKAAAEKAAKQERMDRARINRIKQKDAEVAKEEERLAKLTPDQRLAERNEAAREKRRKEKTEVRERDIPNKAEMKSISIEKRRELLRDALRKADQREGRGRTLPRRDTPLAEEEVSEVEETAQQPEARVIETSQNKSEQKKGLRGLINKGVTRLKEWINGIEDDEIVRVGIGIERLENGMIRLDRDAGTRERLRTVVGQLERSYADSRNNKKTPVERLEMEYVLIGLRDLARRGITSKYDFEKAIVTEKKTRFRQSKIMNSAYRAMEDMLELTQF